MPDTVEVEGVRPGEEPGSAHAVTHRGGEETVRRIIYSPSTAATTLQSARLGVATSGESATCRKVLPTSGLSPAGGPSEPSQRWRV